MSIADTLEVVIEPKKNDIFGDGQRLETTRVQPSDIFKTNDSLYVLNQKNTADGLQLLGSVNNNVVATTFFDPQYRGVMDKLSYGNEGSRQIKRAALAQMPEDIIINFIQEISRTLRPSGHLFLWVDKFHLCEGITHWLKDTQLETVDLIIWKKMTFGMGYRSRRTSEYCIILQKTPKRAKGVWTIRNIPDVWDEKIIGKTHPHQKPIELQKRLIEATSSPQDLIIDPASGSYSVLSACNTLNRQFLGCDLSADPAL
ncbi:MAG: site-specific DNA-methyltransferase (adenine-specific) [Alphaproteobacteria bacterium]|jgi:site-specific DNA-methyltransferase (adenine-specific)